MDLGLSGRCYIVTGASRGLGSAVATTLVDEGATVVVAARDPEAVEKASSLLGASAAGVAVDILDPTAPAQLLAAARATFGRIDGLFVSHGGPAPSDAATFTDAGVRAALALAVEAPIRLLREVCDALPGGGSAVVLTSSTAIEPMPGMAGSNVTRPAVHGYVKQLATDLGPRNIRVNALVPGRFDTDRLRQLRELGNAFDDTAFGPLGRPGQPAELARVAAMLLSPASSYVTGASWTVDGGRRSTL